MVTDKPTSVFARIRQRWAECVLAAIVLSACVLSSIWVFRVPLLQNPDETSHIDYVFSIYSAGRLLNVRTPPSEWNIHPRFEGRKDRVGHESAPYDLLSHQYTQYLIDATDFHRIRFHPEEKVPADYGTTAYYQKLDANAPQTPAGISDSQPQHNPWMITAYPFLYYAVVAVFQKALSLFSSGPAFLFLGARFLSVVFLAGSLILVYALLREFRMRRTRALILTAIVAFFPLTIFVSSSVQPDNLAMLLVLLCSYCALLFKRGNSNDFRLQMVLGLALGALLVTKYHIFLFTAFAVFGTVISEHLFRKERTITLARKIAILLLPSLLLFAVQLWIVWGGGTITGGNLQSANTSLPAGIRNALWDYYRGGMPWQTWWGTFGWADAPLVISSTAFQARLIKVLILGTLVILILVFFRLVQVIITLIKLARRGRWRIALRTAFSNPLLNAYFLFSVFMVLLYALSNNSFFAQGRHWFPYTLAGFLVAIQFAPRAFPQRRVRTAFSTFVMLGLLLYCAVAGYYSLKTINDRFYPTLTSNEKR